MAKDTDRTPATEIESRYKRLLELQRAEADEFRERFEASLTMPIDAGAKLLARTRALREELDRQLIDVPDSLF